MICDASIFIQVMSANNEQTEEHIERQDKVLNQLENKRKMVLDFLSKGEKLMEDPKSPKFLETHVSKLKEAWDDAQKKAQERKKALEDNLESWKVFDSRKVDCAKSLDSADKHFKSIKRIYDLEKGPADLADKLKTAAAMRYDSKLDDLLKLN